METIANTSRSFENKNAGWIKVRVYVGEVEHHKNAEGFVNEFHVQTYTRYTKYFIDRPSHEGFKRSLLNIMEHNHKHGPLVTVKDFRNGEEYMVNSGGLGDRTPFYLKWWFHFLISICGLGFVSFLILICYFRGNNWFVKGEVRVKLLKIVLK